MVHHDGLNMINMVTSHYRVNYRAMGCGTPWYIIDDDHHTNYYYANAHPDAPPEINWSAINRGEAAICIGVAPGPSARLCDSNDRYNINDDGHSHNESLTHTITSTTTRNASWTAQLPRRYAAPTPLTRTTISLYHWLDHRRWWLWCRWHPFLRSHQPYGIMTVVSLTIVTSYQQHH